MFRKISIVTSVFMLAATVIFAQRFRGWGMPRVVPDDTEREPGLLITGVIEDSPAERAGIVRGDILLELDGREITTLADVYDILSGHEAGDAIRLMIQHGDDIEPVDLIIETRLFRAPLGLQFSLPGMHMFEFEMPGNVLPGRNLPGSDLPFRHFYSFPAPGIIIREVVEDGPAANAGIIEGDVITAIDGEKVSARDSLVDAVRERTPGDELTLTVSRRDDEAEWTELTIEVILGADDDGNAFLGVYYLPFFMRGFMFEEEQFDSDWKDRFQSPRQQRQQSRPNDDV